MKNKFNGKKVLVYGMGKSGFSSCKLLHSLGACVSTYDDINYTTYDSFSFVKEPLKYNFDYVIVSPGVKVIGNKILEEFKLRRVKILSELDLGYLFCNGKIIAVTGTNGKTTTCMLIGDMLRQKYEDVVVCGNIGLPLTSVCKNTTKNSIIIVEVSSFQLEESKIFKANIRALLNITIDHIDRHETFENYRSCKLKIFRGKGKNILNLDDEECKSILGKAKKIWFSKYPINHGVYVLGDNIYYKNKIIISTDEISLLGEKNLENVLASVAIAKCLKVKNSDIALAIRNFRPAGHRCEYIGCIRGAKFIDDSKATNISSTENALSAFEHKNLILLLGGKSKGYEFKNLIQKCHNVKCVYCFGQTGRIIYDECLKQNVNAKLFDTMKRASIYARDCADKGEIYLLSPACSSFDEFSSYSERGDSFREIVQGDAYEDSKN